jgi:hypothetical protein
MVYSCGMLLKRRRCAQERLKAYEGRRAAVAARPTKADVREVAHVGGQRRRFYAERRGSFRATSEAWIG